MIVYALLCRQQQLAPNITLIAMLQMQAAIVFLNMTCYTLTPMLVADLMVNVRKSILIGSPQQDFAVLAIGTGLWELLPIFLMIAASCALLVEV